MTTWLRPWRLDRRRARLRRSGRAPLSGRARLSGPILAVAGALCLTACGALHLPGNAGNATPPATSRADYDARLWPQRAVVDLAFTVAPDLSGASGQETVEFTPDQRTCELVFRAWPNNPTMAATGTSLTVESASVDHRPVTPAVEAAGAPSGAPGTLIRLPLTRCADPGQSVHAELAFALRLGADADERVGRSTETRTAWFGSGYPMLSWVRGQGWTRDPAVNLNGETATSEVFTLRSLTVDAPSDMQVTGTGSEESPVAGGSPASTTHRFSAPAVRDVSVGVGRFQLSSHDVGDVHVHLAVPSSGTRVEAADWEQQLDDAITTLSRAYGPFPYADLWVTITPGQSDGTEFPGALQFGDVGEKGLAALVVHEVAHQWFYGLVGNNQARDPWLDESLAAFSEGLALGRKGRYDPDDLPRRVIGQMGQPMSYWADNGDSDAYDEGVYQQGAAVFTSARTDIGAEAFDADLRSYLAANAHKVATPDDLARAFADHPEVIERLRQAGALPEAN